MDQVTILKKAVNAVFALGPELPVAMDRTVRIPFTVGNGLECYVIYLPEQEEIVRIDLPDGTFINIQSKFNNNGSKAKKSRKETPRGGTNGHRIINRNSNNPRRR